MKIRYRKPFLWLGTIFTLGSVGVVVLGCGYQPNNANQKLLQELSSKTAYNKVLYDYYKACVTDMYKAKKTSASDLPAINLPALQEMVYHWYVQGQSIKNPYVWDTMRTDWLKAGYIDYTQAGTLDAPGTIFHFDKTLGYWEITDKANDYANLFADTNKNNSYAEVEGIAISVNRELYDMAYLLRTNPNEVQKWLKGDPSNPDSDKFKPEIHNAGQYFFIDYLRSNLPFIMWKNPKVNLFGPSLTLRNDPTPFNRLSNTINLINARAGDLLLSGPTKPATLTLNPGDLTSYNLLSTTNPFKVKNGDVNPDDSYIKAHPGGKQGWLNNAGILGDTGNAVQISATEEDYAYIQQLLPAYNPHPSGNNSASEGQYVIANWMKTAASTTEISKPEWSVAWQIVFSSDTLDGNARSFWVNNGYYISVHVPALERNLSPAHIYK